MESADEAELDVAVGRCDHLVGAVYVAVVVLDSELFQDLYAGGGKENC